ncbi:hypothetical protein BJ970_006486 [Saccharopolyspora phatthalungensis]|uniref:Uncharacterized protein n=2 Tax=Saccharopolyspora phatthalungensis TaxID=664693 RepID=A0A840QFM8_9PSEU|nr:hypothetical protein [Saccharopolyspora phatthalungensis]
MTATTSWFAQSKPIDPGTAGDQPSELAQDAARYAELLGCSLDIDAATGRIIAVTGDALDAITMPAELGTRVAAGLAISLMSGPILRSPNQRTWTFLTRPCRMATHDVPADLRTAKVSAIARGTKLILPSRWPSPVTPHWVVAPTSTPRTLPGCQPVLGIARRVLAERETA